MTTPETNKPAAADAGPMPDFLKRQEPPLKQEPPKQQQQQQQQQYEFHPIANIFPLMTDEEFEAFKEDIKTKTQQEPIILYQGKILDGRNRYKACKALYRDPITEEYKGSDPLGYVLSANLHRRHLKESQRATIAANLVTTKLGDNQHIKKEGRPIDLPTAAKMLNVSEKSVKRAKNVLENGVPALVQAVKQGKLRVSAVEHFAHSDEQDKLIAECKGDVAEAVKKLPKPPPKKKKPDTAEDLRKQLEAFKETWEGFNPHQKNAFVKANRHELAEILEGLEFEEEVEEEEEADAQPSLS